MTSFGSAIRNAHSRSGFAVLTFLLAILLGSVAPPSLQSQVTLSATPASPECFGVNIQLTADVTNRQTPAPAAVNAIAWPGGLVAQAAVGNAAGAVNDLVLGDDELSGEQNPAKTVNGGGGDFEFDFYGQTLNLSNDGFYVSSNGFITFINNNAATGIIPAGVPDAAAPNHTIILANVDLDPNAGGDIWWQVQNDGNGDILVITFDAVPYVNPFQANLATFQVIIYAADHGTNANRIEWRIDELPQPGGVYGVYAGYENSCGTRGQAAYNVDNVAFGAVNDAAWESVGQVVAAPYADITVQYFRGATLMGTVGPINAPVPANSLVNFNVPVAHRQVGTHNYSAVVTYEYNDCTTDQATSNTVVYEVVANPAPPQPTVSAPACGLSTATASVPANGSNSYTWTQTGGPGGAITGFVPNGTNAAASTTMSFDNTLLNPSGTALTVQVTEALTVDPFCSGSNTRVFTAYRTPDQPLITGSGANNGGINPPALPGASGNPCAGTSRTYTATAVGTDGNTYYRWQLSGAPAGTTINGVAVVAGAQTVTKTGNTVVIAWGNSTTDVTATLVVTASNGTGGSVGSPGSNKSCVGLASAATSVFINGVPAAQQVVQTVPPAAGATSIVCENETRTYGVTLTHPGSSFNWTVTNTVNAPIAAGPGTYNLVTGAPPNNNSATIDWNGAGTYRVQVTETTSGGCVTVHTFHTVTVNNQPNPSLSAPAPALQCTYIGGPITNGQNLAQYTYTVTPESAANKFDWAVSNGIFVSTGLSTASYNPLGAGGTQQVRWTSPGVNQVSVTETIVATGCSKTVTQNVTVTASPTPKTISGPGYNTGLAGNPCAGTGPHVYNVTGPVGGNTYNWNFPGANGGASFVGATNLPTVSINWGAAGTYTLRLTETEPVAGCVTERTFSITVNPQPIVNVTPGLTDVCVGNTVQFSVAPNATILPGATYAWSVIGPGAAIVGPANQPTVTVQGTVAFNAPSVSVTVTNPGAGACSQSNSALLFVNPFPATAAPTVPAPICVGGNYNIQLNATGFPWTQDRFWSATLRPTVPYTGSSNLTLTNANAYSNTFNWNITIGDSSLADILAGGQFEIDVTITDIGWWSGVACTDGPDTYGPYTVEPRPTRPVADFVTPVCDDNYDQFYQITNFNAAYTYSLSSNQGGLVYAINPGTGEITISDWGAPSLTKVITLDVNDGTCNRVQLYDIDVYAAPANPQPAPITINAVCVDSGYFDNPGVLGPVTPTRTVTYSAPSPIAGHWYQWYVTNGFIVEAGNSVGQFTTATQNATSATVVWTGPNPGKVKYLVFTSDPNAAPPAPCFATSIEPTVNLPIIPDVPLSFTTSSNVVDDKVCEGNPVTLTLSGSKVGLSYRVEEWNGATWADAGIAPVAGTGAAINIVVPSSVLDIVSSPTTDHVFRITAKDLAFAPGIAGPCEWLRTATDVITITVYDTPDDKPVVIDPSTALVCDGDNVQVLVGNGGNGTQTFVEYSLERRQLFPALGGWAPVAGSAQMGNGGQITLVDNTTAGIGTGGPLLNVNNYEWRVSALIPPAPLNPPAGGCQVYMATTAAAKVFEYPTDPTVTFSPNPVCWEEDITVNLANTQAGVEYEVNVNGTDLSPQVILQGTGGNVSVAFNSTLIQAMNPNVNNIVANVQVEARLVQNGTYTRPIPASTCPIQYGTTNINVLEKPVAAISGPDSVCGPSTTDFVGAPVTPSPISTYDWLLVAPVHPGTTPITANNTGNGTVNPYTVNWGVLNLNCDGTYNFVNQTIRMIVTNNNGCTDTAFKVVKINPTVDDAAIVGDNQACIYGGYEEHLETYSIKRPDPCVYPAGTTFFWSMPTGTVSGAIRSGQFTETIIAEWHTTGGSGIGTVTATVTLPASHGGCATTRTLDVAVYPLPVPTIAGPASVCQNQQNVAYTADNYPTDQYFWSVIGGKIDGGTGNGVVGDTAKRNGVALNTITVDWNDTPNPNAFVRLKQVSAQGCMEITDFAVVVNPTPTPVINGAEKACDNSVYTYSTANNAPNNVYQWVVTNVGSAGNATITSGANQATATVLTGDITGGASFTLQLTETVLATNCTKTVSKVITIVEKPNPTITRTAPAGGAVGGACLGQTITYGNTDPVAGNPNYSYKWSVSNGTIVGSDEAATLQVTWNTVGSGTVTLMKWHTGSQCTTTVSQTVNIVNTPAPTITGPNSVCGTTEHGYSTPNIAGNTYAWVISGNGVFTSAQNTNSVMVKFNNPTPGNTLSSTLTVTETNTLSGCFASASLVVSVKYQPQVATITRVSPAGPANQACNNSTIIYSVPSNTGATYQWAVTGGTIVSGGTTNQATIQWTNVGTQTITVVEKNATGDCQATSTLNVGVTYQPVPAITGSATVCTGDIVSYSTPAVPGSTYLWSLPSAGGNILSGSTSNEVTIEWILTGARTVQVVETNGNCTATATLTVNIGKTPTSTDISRISPAGNVAVACVNQTITYSTPNNGTSSYLWTVTGGSIIGANNTNTVVVEWTTIGSQTLTVKETTTGTMCSKTDVQNVSVEDQPNPSIAGPTPVCTGDVSTYSVAAVGGHSYSWSLSGGGNIVTSTNSNSINIAWTSAGSHTITVVQNNATGNCTATATMSVSVGQTPIQTSIAGDATVCNGSNEVYSVTAIGGQNYVWTITGGSIVSGQGTNAITVQWTSIGNQTVDVEISTIGTNCKKTLTKNVTVEFQPAPSITGDATVCTDDVEMYSTPANAGSTYAWTVTGGTITSGNTSNAITVQWTTAGTQTVTVTETNASGNCLATASLSVEVSQTPNTDEIVRTDGGNVAHACEGYTYEYNAPTATPAQYDFFWTVTGGEFVDGINNKRLVSVKWTSTGTQTLTVKVWRPGTDCEVTVTQNVSVTPTPQPNINGATISCINKDHVYQTPYVAGNTYEWTITPANVFAPITGYPTSNVIEVKWIQPGLHTMTLTETNVAGGCETTVSINVQVNLIPDPFITSTTGYGNPPGRRPGIVCNFSTHTYTTTLDAANAGNTFIWTVTGGTIITGQYTNTIDVTWGPAGIGTIAVEETVPGSDCITTILDSIDIRPTPSPAITGQVNPCVNSVQQYTTPFVAGNSYNWTVVGGVILNGQGTNTLTVRWNSTNWPNTIAGSVSVTEWVTDVLPSMSCINSTTMNVTVRPDPPTPNIIGNFTVCATDLNTTPATDNITTYSTTAPAQGSAQGFVTYQWTVSSNGQIVGSSTGTSTSVRWFNAGTTPTVGTITIRLTSTFGCTSQFTQSVTINPIPTPDISGPLSVCHNALHTYSTPGYPGHVYNWTVTGGNVIRSGQGTPNVTVEWTVPGTYDLTVSETNTYGCTVLNRVSVTVNELPTAMIEVSGPTTFCQGGDVTLTAPIGFASYVWSTGETARSIVVRTTGQYWVKVTDANGCSNNSDTVTVNVFPNSLPIITVSGPTTFCEGGSVTLTAPAGFDAYLWSTGETTQSITVSETGSYTVTVADNNGCTGTSTEVDVFVNPKPSPVLTVVGSTTICSGEEVEVRAPLGYVSYTWISTSGTSYGTDRSITVSQSDTIYCQVVDANGCVGESDTVIITVSPVVAPIVAANGPTEFCDGGSVKLSAPEGFATYFWSNGATTREIVVQDGGNYSVTVTSNAACESVSLPTEVVVFPLPARPSIARTGDTLKAVSVVAESYQWYRNGVMMPGAEESFLVVNQPGVYRVSIADNNTCASISDGFDVILTDVNDDVFAGHAPELSIFPNPTNGQFTIEGEINVTGNVQIELVNMIGEVVMTNTVNANGGMFSQAMNMGTLASGVYNVVVTTENHRWTIRLVRQ